MKRALYLVATMAAAAGPWAPLRAAEPAPAVGRESAAPEGGPYVRPGVPHPGSDQILWVPTFAQAEEAARATGRMILVMGSVSSWDGY
jgi:hypothetical protein